VEKTDAAFHCSRNCCLYGFGAAGFLMTDINSIFFICYSEGLDILIADNPLAV
jgi:hypothetical protein